MLYNSASSKSFNNPSVKALWCHLLKAFCNNCLSLPRIADKTVNLRTFNLRSLNSPSLALFLQVLKALLNWSIRFLSYILTMFLKGFLKYSGFVVFIKFVKNLSFAGRIDFLTSFWRKSNKYPYFLRISLSETDALLCHLCKYFDIKFFIFESLLIKISLRSALSLSFCDLKASTFLSHLLIVNLRMALSFLFLILIRTKIASLKMNFFIWFLSAKRGSSCVILQTALCNVAHPLM